jgi:cell volume regulation protein A
MTIADFMTTRLGGRAEYADRVAVSPVELIVRDVADNGRISAVGVSLEPEASKPKIPLFYNLREIVANVRTLVRTRARHASRNGRPESGEPAPPDPSASS